MESLQKLKPLFEGGVVTAGNASGVNDGAAALLIGKRKWGEKNGKKPIASIRLGRERRRRAAHHGRRAGLRDSARARARRAAS